MKKINRALLLNLCSLCIAYSGLMYWDKFSLLFFGEPKYPEQTEN